MVVGPSICRSTHLTVQNNMTSSRCRFANGPFLARFHHPVPGRWFLRETPDNTTAEHTCALWVSAVCAEDEQHSNAPVRHHSSVKTSSLSVTGLDMQMVGGARATFSQCSLRLVVCDLICNPAVKRLKFRKATVQSPGT